MNILFLSPWLPWPPFGGALIRILETLRSVSRRHRITFLTLLRDPGQAQHLNQLDGLCERIIATPLSDSTAPVLRRLSMGLLRGRPLIQSMHYDRQLAEHVRQLTSQHPYDIIHVEFSFMAPYMPFVSPQSTAKRVLVMHNVESLRFSRELQFASGARRLALLTDHWGFPSWEEACLPGFDAVLAVSKLEEAWIRTHAPGAAVAVLPNGVNVNQFSPLDPAPESRTVVFTGLMNYPPNVDAVVWFCDVVLPIVHRTHPDVLFRIVGDKPTPAVLALGARAGVSVTGRVPDIRPHMADSLAVVVPVRSGAGTRLKILEAMAVQRPVVSTSLGAEGLDVAHGKHLLLGDTPEALASHIVALIDRPDQAQQIALAGRELAQAKYDWRICLDPLEDVYQSLAGSRQQGRGSRTRVS